MRLCDIGVPFLTRVAPQGAVYTEPPDGFCALSGERGHRAGDGLFTSQHNVGPAKGVLAAVRLSLNPGRNRPL